MIEEAGTHYSRFPARYTVFPDRLEQAGYKVGFTGKGWAPGEWDDQRTRNPAGPEYNERTIRPPYGRMSDIDYAGNLGAFLEERGEDAPFYFWMGVKEPHRGYAAGIAEKAGIDIDTIEVPPFLPDHPMIRNDLAGYAAEIAWLDEHVGRAIALLEDVGELDNTIIIITSDNGMPYPYAKTNLYDPGIHVPLAISWPRAIEPGQVIDDVVSLLDVTASIYDASGVSPDPSSRIVGTSLMPLLRGERGALAPQAVFAGRERHTFARYQNLGYPMRAIRTKEFLYIRNFAPDRNPAGDPIRFSRNGEPRGPYSGYLDMSGDQTIKRLYVRNKDHPVLGEFFRLATGLRPAEELFRIESDPYTMRNLADHPDFQEVREELSARLEATLRETGDPRLVGPDFDIFESYPRLKDQDRSFARPDGPE